jgi:hypothetical protein
MDDRYAAGLFDGEGYVRINRWEKPNSTHIRYNLFVGIGMSHLPIIQALQREYRGSLNMNRHDLRNPRARIQFTWNVASRIAATFLRRIEPHVIVKKDEVLIALRFQDHVENTPYVRLGRKKERRENHEEIYAYREGLYREISALKKRSFPPLLNDGPCVNQ